MRIFYDGYIFTQQRYGGINRYFIELTNRIPAIDSSVNLYLYRFPGSFTRDKLLQGKYFMLPKAGGQAEES